MAGELFLVSRFATDIGQTCISDHDVCSRSAELVPCWLRCGIPQPQVFLPFLILHSDCDRPCPALTMRLTEGCCSISRLVFGVCGGTIDIGLLQALHTGTYSAGHTFMMAQGRACCCVLRSTPENITSCAGVMEQVESCAGGLRTC